MPAVSSPVSSLSVGKRLCQFFQKYFLCFVFYSVFGWCYEVFLEVVVYRWGFSNRGVLFGPYCPVYGVGALFVGCMVSATLVELGASYLCQALTGSWPWQTYVNYRYHFQGRIALSPSIRFGLGGLFFLYVLQPLLDRGLAALSPRARGRLAALLAVLMGIDLVFFLVGTFS